MEKCFINVAEPLAWMLHPGSAGSNTGADHLRLLGEAIAALPSALRRKLMITCDGADASHALVRELDWLAYSVGWELGAREKAAIGKVPEPAWQAAIAGKGQVRERRSDGACGNQRCAHHECWIEEANVAELTGLLREGPAGDQLKGWPKTMRVFARRERPHPARSCPCSRPPAAGATPVGHQPARSDQGLARGQCACIDAAHRGCARVEDVILLRGSAGLLRDVA